MFISSSVKCLYISFAYVTVLVVFFSVVLFLFLRLIFCGIYILDVTSVVYCYLTNHSKIQWLKSRMIYYFSRLLGSDGCFCSFIWPWITHLTIFIWWLDGAGKFKRSSLMSGGSELFCVADDLEHALSQQVSWVSPTVLRFKKERGSWQDS